ncbi:molecular chaperone DnaJ [Desulfogranum mediterraneum]|uniref:molecular chaperone DnaJ n=1 Tax=Desulfogranum mediterraneum TaxID=160661 RepID=UPI001427AC61|nr:molecular chaperone DnaJ [Desulfogranum mediterraneum]
MTESSVNLHDCSHCKGTGTCDNGEDGYSCSVCAKEQGFFWNRKKRKGLPCCVCGGMGRTEATTDRLNKRMAPALAMYLSGMLLLLVMVALLLNSQHFNEILAFSSAIIGSVTGFYFSNRGK